MGPGRSIEPHRQSEHLIEVAVVDVTLPVDVHGVPAHQVLDVLLDVSGPQQVEILGESPLGNEGTAEAADRHVRKGQQPIEPGSESAAELCFVGPLKLALCRRQYGALRIADEIECETSPFLAVAQSIEPPDPLDTRVEDTVSALAIDVFVQVARQGGDDGDPALRQEFGEIFLPGLEENREIASIDCLHAVIHRSIDQETGSSGSTPAPRR